MTSALIVATTLISLSLICVVLFAAKTIKDCQVQNEKVISFAQTMLSQVATLVGQGATGAQETAQSMVKEMSSAILQLVSPQPVPGSPVSDPREALKADLVEPWLQYRTKAEQREATEVNGVAPPAGWMETPDLSMYTPPSQQSVLDLEGIP